MTKVSGSQSSCCECTTCYSRDHNTYTCPARSPVITLYRKCFVDRKSEKWIPKFKIHIYSSVPDLEYGVEIELNDSLNKGKYITSRSSHSHKACRTICDRDQDFWLTKIYLDCLILLKKGPWSLDILSKNPTNAGNYSSNVLDRLFKPLIDHLI